MSGLDERGIKELHAACTNWARWSRPGRGGPARCGSIEGRYLPEKLTDEASKERDQKAPSPINHRDAERVEAAVVLLLKSARYIEHQVITLMYLEGLSIKELARRYAMGELETESLWRSSLACLKHQLDAVDAREEHRRRRQLGRSGTAGTTGSGLDTP